MSDGPEEDCAEGVESETHQDSSLVSAALENFSSNGREKEVSL